MKYRLQITIYNHLTSFFQIIPYLPCVALVERLYRAQKERDFAIMARLRHANEERDEAMKKLKQIQSTHSTSSFYGR